MGTSPVPVPPVPPVPAGAVTRGGAEHGVVGSDERVTASGVDVTAEQASHTMVVVVVGDAESAWTMRAMLATTFV